MNFNKVVFLLFFFIGIPILKSHGQEVLELGKKQFIDSKILSEEREYWISLPASYSEEHKSYKKYPVIVLLDGNTHFHSAAGMIKFMAGNRAGSMQIPEMIVVGVLNVNRERDFTPDKIITRRENKTGGGAKFLAFLETELIPKIDGEYRTQPFRILFGHSLGGLLTAHAYMQKNTQFNSFLSIDPSFGNWSDSIMDKKIDLVDEKVFTRPIYIATANWGKRNIRNRDRHVRFYESLNSKCKDEYKGELEYFENENHSTVSLPAFYSGLQYIFKGYNYSYREATSRAALVNYFEKFSEGLSHEFLPPEELVNRIGYNKLRSKKEEDRKMALEFFKLNVENYSQSFNVYDSLGEAALKLGLEQEALKNFEKSLELNPENANATQMIKMKLLIKDK